MPNYTVHTRSLFEVQRIRWIGLPTWPLRFPNLKSQVYHTEVKNKDELRERVIRTAYNLCLQEQQEQEIF